MDSYLAPVLSSVVYRILELQPDVSAEDAIKQARSILRDSDLIGLSEADLDARIAEACGRYSRRGVINPEWLRKKELRAYFFLANAKPGWLEHLLSAGENDTQGISQYILYGAYDSLIILYGTQEEADRQRAVMENDIYADSLSFMAQSVPMIYRQPVDDLVGDTGWADAQLVNSVAEDYDRPERAELRERLLASRIMLGPVWVPEAHPRERLIAFVGLALRGRHPVEPEQMLKALREHKSLERTLVHLFETNSGHPFKYFVKLVCKDQDELDHATNAIGTIRFGPVHVEGTTMVVANGFDRLPIYRSPGRARSVELGELGELPELADVDAAAIDMVRAIGPGATPKFNKLDPSLKLAILGAIARIREELDDTPPGGTDERRGTGPGEAKPGDPGAATSSGEPGAVPAGRRSRPRLDGEWSLGLKEAERQFGNGALDGAGAGLDGAVAAATHTVELAAKRAVRLLAESQFGLDYAAAQKEFRLPGKDFRKLTLGNIVQAFATVRENTRFQAMWPALDSNRLEALANFTEDRNRWAHGDKHGHTPTGRVHSAADVIVNAIELTRWLDSAFIQTIPDHRNAARGAELREAAAPAVVISESRPEKNLGFFISHSFKDGEIAQRISEALRAMGLPVFFAKWSIGAADSILDKISQAIVRHDTLAVLLSPNSVESEWVKRELDAALMAQLKGHDVRVLPLMVADCEMPALLAGIKYIDFRGSFEDGFIEIIKYIQERRNAKP